MLVLVTRAESDGLRTARALETLGHEAVLTPVIQIVPTGEPAPEGPHDALIVTSARAADALATLGDRTKPVFAVGGRTAEALRQAGFLHVTTGPGDAASLAALIGQRLAPGRRLLHVTGRHRKAEPEASLSAAGFTVVSWEAYEARAVDSLTPDAVAALRSGRIGAALHYSRRSAALLLKLAEAAGLTAPLRDILHGCLSADAAAPLVAAGLAVRVAREPSEEALLEALGSP